MSKNNMSLDEQIRQLTEQVGNGNLEVVGALNELVMKKEQRNAILQQHDHEIYQGKDGRWRTKLRMPDGSIKTIRKSKLTDLEDALIETYGDIKNHHTLLTAYNEWIDEKERYKKRTPATISRYRTEAKRVFLPDNEICQKDMRDLTEGDLLRFIDMTVDRNQYTEKSSGLFWIILRGTLRYAKANRYLDISPMQFFSDMDTSDVGYVENAEKPDEAEVFSEAEATLMMNRLSSEDTLLSLGIQLMFLTGLRVGELSALRRDCVDIKEMVLHIRATETQYNDENGHRMVAVRNATKTKEGRRDVFLPDSARIVLKKLQSLNPFGEFVFQRPDGSRIRSKSFNDKCKRTCRALGIPERTTHKIRKTYASTLIDADVNSKIIQQQLGHKDFATTKKYYDRDRRNSDMKRSELNRAINL